MSNYFRTEIIPVEPDAANTAVGKSEMTFLVVTFLKINLFRMEIILNDQIQTVSESATLFEIVFTQLGEKQNGVAVALNNAVIAKNHWQTTQLKSNDQILIIKATQGG